MTRIIATRFGRRGQRPARPRHDDGRYLAPAILDVLELVVAASIAALSAGSALAGQLATLAASR